MRLTKAKKLDFATVYSSKKDFLTPKAKKAFIQLEKTFIKRLILCYFNQVCHIYIQINTSKYSISGVSSQQNLDHNSLYYITHKDLIFPNPKLINGTW